MMVTRAKDRYRSRFNFGTNPDAQEKQTGTLTDLIDEINLEDTYSSSGAHAMASSAQGFAINAKSLERTLTFIQQATGQTFTSVRQELPLVTLKTIKLLYIKNAVNDRHLFNLLEPPRGSSRSTMEFSTTSSIARDKTGAAIIQSLCNDLVKEIDPGKREAFDALLPTPEQLNLDIEKTNDAIYQHLTDQLGHDQALLTRAYEKLAHEIGHFRYEKNPDAGIPLNEAMYCYLRGLGFIHFVIHHQSFMEYIRVTHPIQPIDALADELCQSLSEIKQSTIRPTDKVVSVKDFPKLVACHTKEFRALVKAATGLDTRTDVLIQNLARAQRILVSYAYRSFDESNMDAHRVSVLEIVAALCSVRYQQAVRTEYKPYWHGQDDKGSSPQRHFDKTIDPDDPYQHQGVLLIYLYRFYDFLYAFLQTTASISAWMQVQLARLDGYVRILALQDIGALPAVAEHFDHMCMAAAREIGAEESSR